MDWKPILLISSTSWTLLPYLSQAINNNCLCDLDALFPQGMEIVQTMNSDPGLAVGTSSTLKWRIHSCPLVLEQIITSSVCLQATRHLMALTSRERSTSTRLRTTTTLASSLATRIHPASMWWCGNRQSRLTGNPYLSEPWPSPHCSSRFLLSSTVF